MDRVHARDFVPINWDVFMMEFKKTYIPIVVQDRKATEFVQLIQVQMFVSEYDAKFKELSRYAPQIISIEKEKAWKLQEGLVYYIKSWIALLMFTDYAEADERVLIIEDTLREIGTVAATAEEEVWW